jgi:hypothetical protein
MKTIKNSIFAMLALFAVSCNVDDVQDRMVAQAIDAPVLTSPEAGNSYVLNADNPDGLAERLIWTAGNFGEGVVPSYDIEIDYAGQGFDTPVIIGTTTGTTQLAISTNVLNEAVLGLEAPADVATAFEIRVKAYVGTMVMYSNTAEINITPYVGEMPLVNLFLVGDALESGWNNDNDNIPLFREPAAANMYHYTGYFNAGAFKMLTVKGAWHPQYGMTAEGVLGVSNADGTNEPQNIAVTTAGYYKLTVDTEAMTYTFEPFEAGNAPLFTTMGVLGSGTPTAWDSDTDMLGTAVNPHLWHVNDFVLIDGEMKFREGDAWTNSWGEVTPISGLATNGGPNIPVTAGTYDIWFNDLDGRYILVPSN